MATLPTETSPLVKSSTRVDSDSDSNDDSAILPSRFRADQRISRSRSHRRIHHTVMLRAGIAACCLSAVFMIVTSGSGYEMWRRFEAVDYSPRQMHAQCIAMASMSKYLATEPARNLKKSMEHKVNKNKTKEHHGEEAGNKKPTLAAPEEAPIGCESTVMIMRHCEKGNLKSHCNYVGYERAVYLATQFGSGKRWPSPSIIYALDTGRHHHKNYREIELVKPLAKQSGVDVNSAYGTDKTGKLARAILDDIRSGDECGKLTVVSWKHSDIAKLAQRLGCGPLEGCPVDYRGKDFDSVWQIKYVYRHHPHRDKMDKHPSWKVFGSVQLEGFDPLAFAHAMGGYGNGTATDAWISNLPQDSLI